MGTGRSRFLTLIVLLAVITYAVFMLSANRARVAAARTDLSVKQTEADELIRRNEELRYLIDHAAEPDILAEVARDRLGLVMPGDRIFRDINN